jgi:hypothetical protein
MCKEEISDFITRLTVNRFTNLTADQVALLLDMSMCMHAIGRGGELAEPNRGNTGDT